MTTPMLRRDTGLLLTFTATLAVAIGANTTMFSIVNSILLRPLPYPGGERICWINERLGRDQAGTGVAADYYSLREENRVFEEVAAFDPLTVNWTGVERPEQLNAAEVSASFFRVMAMRPMMGRYLAAEDEGSKAPALAMVSYGFWRNRLASDPQAVGRRILLDRAPRTIVGVMPRGFDYPGGTEVWLPLSVDEASQRPRSAQRPMRLVQMLARIRPGVGERELQAEMARLTAAIRAEYPKEIAASGFLNEMAITAVPLARYLTGNLRPALVVLSGAVALVLLIACVNLANLLLARAASRERELAIRMALGASRRRIVRQMLLESVMLALPGGLAGIGLAAGAVRMLNAVQPAILASYPPVAFDAPALLFTVLLTFTTSIIFGLAPAFAGARTAPMESLKAGQTQSAAPRMASLRRLLAAAELSLSLVLLIGAGLLARSFLKLARVDLGFRADHLLTLRVNLTSERYASAETQMRFYDDVLARIRQLPVVREAAVSQDIPLSGEHPWDVMVYQVPGRAPVSPARRPTTLVTRVSREYFATLGIPLKSGRFFDDRDNPAAPDGIVVSEMFARRAFPGGGAVGRQIVLGVNSNLAWTIAGVVGDVRGNALGAEPQPLIYRCTCQGANRFLSLMRISVRTAQDPAAAARAIEQQVFAVDRDQPVFDVKTMEQRLDDSLAPQRFQLVLIGAFAAIAVLLAGAGVYGLTAYLVSRRTREIGIRVALGARREDIVRLVGRESATLAGIAIAAGLAGAWGLTRYAASMLYGVTALDAPTFAAASVVLAAIVIAASLGPARRAAAVDPLAALREE